jgi:hypothetical protein
MKQYKRFPKGVRTIYAPFMHSWDLCDNTDLEKQYQKALQAAPPTAKRVYLELYYPETMGVVVIEK